MHLLPESRSNQFTPQPEEDSTIETLKKMLKANVSNLLIESPDGNGTVFCTTDPAVSHVLKMIFEENENLMASEGQDFN